MHRYPIPPTHHLYCTPTLCLFRPHRSCFWLSLVASICDTLGLILLGYMVIVSSDQLGYFAAYEAVLAAGSVVAVLWNNRMLCSRTAELRLNTAVLGLATMPGYFFLLAGLIMLMASTPQHQRECLLLVSCALCTQYIRTSCMVEALTTHAQTHTVQALCCDLSCNASRSHLLSMQQQQRRLCLSPATPAQSAWG